MPRRPPVGTSRLTADLTPELHEMLEQLAQAHHTPSKVEMVRLLIRQGIALHQKVAPALRAQIYEQMLAESPTK